MGKFITRVSDIATTHNAVYILPDITGNHFVHIPPILGSANRRHSLSTEIQTPEITY